MVMCVYTLKVRCLLSLLATIIMESFQLRILACMLLLLFRSQHAVRKISFIWYLLGHCWALKRTRLVNKSFCSEAFARWPAENRVGIGCFRHTIHRLLLEGFFVVEIQRGTSDIINLLRTTHRILEDDLLQLLKGMRDLMLLMLALRSGWIEKPTIDSLVLSKLIVWGGGPNIILQRYVSIRVISESAVRSIELPVVMLLIPCSASHRLILLLLLRSHQIVRHYILEVSVCMHLRDLMLLSTRIIVLMLLRRHHHILWTVGSELKLLDVKATIFASYS